jgi:hypothetical protein
MAQAASVHADEVHKITVRTIRYAPMGMFVDNPKYIFAIVNLGSTDCFAVSPPLGVTIYVGDTYLLVEDGGVNEDVKGYLSRVYPKCTIVKEPL